MKRLSFAILLLALVGTAVAQTTLTPNVSLQIPSYQQTNWQVPLIYDLNLLDGILGGTQTLTVGTATPAVNTFPVFVTANTSAFTVTNLLGGFNGQTVRIFCGPGDTFTAFANSATMKLASSWSCATFSSLTLTNVNTVWTETGRTGGAATTLFYQTIQNASGSAQTQRPTVEFTGTAVASVTDDAANGRTIVTLTASAGSGVTLQTNGVNNTSQTALNFINSAAINGLTLTFANPATGNVQLGYTGTLTDAGLTSAYSGVGTCAANNVVNSLSRNASPGCVQLAFANLSGTATDAQLASAYSGTGACGAGTFASTLNRNAPPTCTAPPAAVTEFVWGTTFGQGTGQSACSNGFACIDTVFPSAHTITRFMFFVVFAPVGCSTNSTMGIRDVTSATNLQAVTINQAAGTFVDSGPISVAMTAGHRFQIGVISPATGCSTSPQVESVSAILQ